MQTPRRKAPNPISVLLAVVTMAGVLALLTAVVWLAGTLGRTSGPRASDQGLLGVRAPAAATVVRAAGADDPNPAWVRRTSARTGVPEPAVRAYARAELTLHDSRASCRLSWTTLGGIGWVESQHGTLDGRVLDQDGMSSSPIRGPSLDGTAFRAVGDGSGWARAMGPLQFIPQTWARWSSDGDHDGRRTVDDIDDAALAAARYLCADAHDLTTGAGWVAAVRSYNHSDVYVDQVRRAATTYARAAG